MKNLIIKARNPLPVLTLCLLILSGLYPVYAQQYKWLAVGELQSPFNAVGAEYELEFMGVVGTGVNYFS